MIEFGVVAAADHRQPVGMGRDMRKEIGDLEARLAVTPKRATAGKHLGRGGLRELEIEVAKTLRQRLTGIAVKHRLGIKRVELAGPAMHEE